MTDNDDEAMLIARALVEQHISHCGMIEYPVTIKDAIAKALREAAKVSAAEIEQLRAALTKARKFIDYELPSRGKTMLVAELDAALAGKEGT